MGLMVIDCLYYVSVLSDLAWGVARILYNLANSYIFTLFVLCREGSLYEQLYSNDSLHYGFIYTLNVHVSSKCFLEYSVLVNAPLSSGISTSYIPKNTYPLHLSHAKLVMLRPGNGCCTKINEQICFSPALMSIP